MKPMKPSKPLPPSKKHREGAPTPPKKAPKPKKG